jgi:actin-like ATPase involved in cell morphogenesis
MNFLLRLFGPNDVGIDLGGANVRVWMRGEGLVLE